MGIGPTEIFIIAVILLVLFGPTLVAFFVGYTLGKRRGAQPSAATSTAPVLLAEVEPPGAAEPPSAPAPAPEPFQTPAPTTDLQEKQPDE